MRKYETGFSLAELLIVGAVLAVLGSLGWLMYAHDHSQQIHSVYSSYADCVSHGGQPLQYDDAIQFDACKGTSSNLYLQYSAQNLPRIDENRTTTTPNVIASAVSASSDLVSYLTYNYTGCDIGQPANSGATGYYKIIKEIPSGWALLQYGCSSRSSSSANNAYMIAMKLSSGWVELSPTNNFLPNGTPSCLLVDMFNVPGSLTSQCYQNTGYDDGSLRSVTGS